MLKSLKAVGEEIGVRRGFKADFKKPNNGDILKIIEMDDESIEVIETIECEDYEELDDEIGFFYKGGNPAVGGTLGIGGISPFYLNPENITKTKINGSSSFKDIYNDEYDDDLLNRFFSMLKEHNEWFNDKEVDWVYVKKIDGEETQSRHEYFIKKYLKTNSNSSIDRITGVCNICGEEKTLKDTLLPFYTLGKRYSNLHFERSKEELTSASINLCVDCEPKITAGWKYLYRMFNQQFVLVPRSRDDESKEEMKNFVSLLEENEKNLPALKAIIQDKPLYDAFDFSFIVTDTSQSRVDLKRVLPNFKLFYKEFEDTEDTSLITNDKLKYFDKKMRGDYDIAVPNIGDFFDLENLLMFFFVDNTNRSLDDLSNNDSGFHFYNLYHEENRWYDPNNNNRYNKDLPRNSMDTVFTHLLDKYRNNLFSFIYECDLDALRKTALQDIVLTFLRYEIRKIDYHNSNRFSEFLVEHKISEALNYYNFLCSKIFGGISMKERIKELKTCFDEFEDGNTREKIRELVNNDESDQSIHYLVGQFIALIDAARYKADKNKIFDSFISSLNRKNAKERFAEQILQRQNYYIEERGKKAKFVLELLTENLDNLFQQDTFHDGLIALISGYYGDMIIRTEKVSEDEVEHKEFEQKKVVEDV